MSRTGEDSIIDRLSDAVLIVDQTGVVRLSNPAADAMFRQDLVGELFGFAIESEEPTEITLLSSEGKTRQGEMRCSEMMLDRERVQVVCIRDVTNRKQLEQDLDEANQRLSGLIRLDSLTGLLNRRGLSTSDHGRRQRRPLEEDHRRRPR